MASQAGTSDLTPGGRSCQLLPGGVSQYVDLHLPAARTSTPAPLESCATRPGAGGSRASGETPSIFPRLPCITLGMQMIRGILGVLVVLGTCVLLSRNRRAIRPRVVISGLALQIVLAAFLIKTDVGRTSVAWLTEFAERFLSFSYEGSSFVFGSLGQKSEGDKFHLAFQALPIVIYFSAVTSALYHLGILQVAVWMAGRLLGKALGVSGAEAMSVVADVFVGMTEAPLVVRPYIERMTRSELLALMTGGLATIAGTVLGVYMTFVGKEYAPHLITASFMAAPAAFVLAKIVLPELEEPVTGQSVKLVLERQGSNLLDAIALGVRDGLHLALNIAAMLIAFYSLIALVNWPLAAAGTSLQSILGHALAPFAWALGVNWQDAASVGSLLGTKVVANELIAYLELRGLIQRAALQPHSVVIATFALCGFANFGSVGVVLGGLGHLAPSRRKDLAELAVPALVTGALATCLTAAIAGMFA